MGYNSPMDWSRHFKQILDERNIRQEWVDQTIASADRIEEKPDGTTHFVKRIDQYDKRWLRVIVTTRVEPHRVVTAFFDRRLRRKSHED